MDRKPDISLSSSAAGLSGAAPRPSDPNAALRAERDRFVALAFAAADLLLELDSEQRVVFAAGATAPFVGLAPQALTGKSFLDLVAASDRSMMREVLAQGARGKRMRNIVLRLQSAGDDGQPSPSAPLALLGYRLPEMGGRYFLSLRAGGHEPRLGDDDPVPQVTGGDSGLCNPRSFASLAAERLGAAGAVAVDERGKSYSLTLLRFLGLNELRRRLERDARGQLVAAIGGGLRALAVNGDLAGQFDGENFGLIHPKDADLAEFERSIVEMSCRFDPQYVAPAATAKKPSKKSQVAPPGGVMVARAVVDMDVAGMGQPEQVKALTHIVNRFTDGRLDDFKIASASAGLSAMIGETVHKLAEFRSVISDADFAMAFQPIVALTNRKIHHFEVLARFPKFGDRLTPYEAITFAEQTGLICDFDLAMCSKALDWLEARRLEGKAYTLAVNLSGSSIGTPSFVKALHKLLQRHDAVRRLVVFEITESARIGNLRGVNAIVKGLRAEGHKVCLDDFGAGASAFHYLRALDVDVVKIDGVYVRDAFKNSKGAAFLKAMASLCTDLGIATVAEMVEDESNLAFLRQCGVDYGQGWLFGKPSFDIADFEPKAGSAPATFAPGRPLLGKPAGEVAAATPRRVGGQP
jgi:EAL domain-containing protein (putative c-di-GMP-specific phosphodiesterase class I)